MNPPRPDPAFDFAWGERGLEARLADAEVVVVVDVLSFSTAVDVALGEGATVWPCPWRDERAEGLARTHGARLAVPRSRRDAAHPLSLSPAGLAQALSPGDRIVLPSPNGSHLSHRAAASGATVYAACLRSARAVAAALPDDAAILVLAAGERWPDGSLRPAIEDALGAGALLAALAARFPSPRESPEATHARLGFEASVPRLGDLLHESVSGRELIDGGFAADVRIAASLNASDVVPRLVEGAYRPVSG